MPSLCMVRIKLGIVVIVVLDNVVLMILYLRNYKIVIVRFDKGRLMEGKPAPDPENIVWENYHVSSTSQFLRRSVSYGITLLLICVSINNKKI